jgi:hypothetical protein
MPQKTDDELIAMFSELGSWFIRGEMFTSPSNLENALISAYEQSRAGVAVEAIVKVPDDEITIPRGQIERLFGTSGSLMTTARRSNRRDPCIADTGTAADKLSVFVRGACADAGFSESGRFRFLERPQLMGMDVAVTCVPTQGTSCQTERCA